MDKNIDYNSFPGSFMHCFNNTCLRGDQCLRRQMALRIPRERVAVTTFNLGHLMSLTGEDCPYFLLDQPQRYAKGFTHLLDNVPNKKAAIIKSQMISFFGRTMYYRCFRKERLIKPAEQARIRQMFRDQGLSDELHFDEYVAYYDLD